MLSPVARLIKQRTASTHERVEASLRLLDDPSGARLRVVLTRFAGFWLGTEPFIDEWAVAHPRAAVALSWPRRRRGEVLRHDLLRLGLSVRELAAVPEAPAVFGSRRPSEAEVLGWLYVSEGSTLGGAVIDRALRARPDAAVAGLRTFTPYLEGPGPMWRAYLDYLHQWAGEDTTRRDAVVEAALTSFTALESWLAPIPAEVPA